VNFNLSLLFYVSKIVYLILLLVAIIAVWRNGFQNLVLSRFNNKHQDTYRAHGLPFIKKYLDRQAVREELEDKELTLYANQLAQKSGIKSKEFVVLMATEEDPNVAGKAVMAIDCVDTMLIMFEKVFVENNSREVLQSLVALNVGRCVNNDLLARVTVLSDVLWYQGFIFSGVTLLVNTFAPLWWIGVIVGAMLSGHLFNFVYAQWVQGQDLAIDAFVAENCGGKDAALEMLNAIMTAAPTPPQSLYDRIYAKLFGFASYQQRIDAINKL